MKIRECTNEDSKEIYNLICQLKNEKINLKKFLAIYNTNIMDSKKYYIVAVKENNIIAFLSSTIDYQLQYGEKTITIDELIVSEEYRGHGVGKLLLENIISYAKDNACYILQLTSGFERKNAHKFYEKNGFKKVSYKFIKKLI